MLGGVLIEAAFVGTIATLVGSVCGVAGVGALRWVVGLTGVSLLTGPSIVSPTSIAVAATVGIGATILSAWIPARRAAATPPIEALRESAAEPRVVSRARTASGLVLAAAAIAGGAVAVVGSNPVWLVLAAAIVPALVLGGPAIVTASARGSSPAAHRAAGVCGSIAAGNLAASPRRSASTALALMLGTAMVTMFAIFASSLTSGVGSDVREGLHADLVVTSATPDFPTVDPTLAGRIAALPDVDTVAALSIAEGIVAGKAEALRRIVRLEVALLSFVAASIGIAVAVGFGWALIDVAGGAEIPSVVVPWPRLAVTLAVAAAAGIVAAAWPAFRVSRVPVLELVGRDR